MGATSSAMLFFSARAIIEKNDMAVF